MDTSGTSNKLKLASFNCKHIRFQGSKFEFIKQVMQQSVIMFIQEHCLFESQLSKFKNICEDTDMTGKSSMNETIPLIGHPHGGCGESIKPILNVISVRSNALIRDLCEICLTVNNDILLILNAYMPYDTNRQDVHFIEFMEVMSEVDQLIQQLNPFHWIFDGDLNTDLEKS